MKSLLQQKLIATKVRDYLFRTLKEVPENPKQIISLEYEGKVFQFCLNKSDKKDIPYPLFAVNFVRDVQCLQKYCNISKKNTVIDTVDPTKQIFCNGCDHFRT